MHVRISDLFVIIKEEPIGVRTRKHRRNNRSRTFLYKKIKTRFNIFILLTLFLFSTAKITQITFPDSSDIGNVLTIKDNGKNMLRFCYIYG